MWKVSVWPSTAMAWPLTILAAGEARNRHISATSSGLTKRLIDCACMYSVLTSSAEMPRLSAIVGKMLPHDALRMACFDQRGRAVVNTSTADLPDMMISEGEDVIIDDLRTRALGASAAAHAGERLVGAGYRSVLGVSTLAPEPLVRVAFWSKRPMAFTRAHVPLARRIA